ncbi:hypothetical protein EJP82_25985 [Paenibacillus anaericanus]|uniref:Uncharacterized protein n=1 Tax=Paenibacillus anaericanus TaxID=170367 RepID=A0A433XXA1_9BACL|nr:hypothetical protein [Paenibacillus anaericanus]RUT39484.1 hypothetical protein EJP82_25985 [Paenibacillus anaericanus]
MRVALFGDISCYPSLSGVPWFPLVPGDPLVGEFTCVVYLSTDAEAILPSDSWFASASYFLSVGVPVFWCVREHPLWCRKIEAELVTLGAVVVCPTLDPENIVAAVGDFLFPVPESVNAVYSLRFDSSHLPEDSIIIQYLSTLDDPEDWMKSVIREHILK